MEEIKKKKLNIELYEASEKGSLDQIKSLLRQGADPNYYNYPEDQKNSLHIACEKGFIDAAKLLIDGGADVKTVSATYQATPLIFAVQAGKPALVKLLVSLHASLNAENGYGNTALHTACKLGYDDIIQTLIESGASVSISNHKGSTPLHFLAHSTLTETQYREILKLFNLTSTTIDATDTRGNTPFLTACMAGNLALMTVLLEYGASKEVRNSNNETYEDIAEFYHHSNIVTALNGHRK